MSGIKFVFRPYACVSNAAEDASHKFNKNFPKSEKILHPGNPDATFSKELPYIHRKEIFRADATITYNKRSLWIEKSAEFIQPVRPFLRIAFHLDGYHRTFLAQNEIDFIIPVSPIKYFKTMQESLAYQISADTRFKDSPPCPAVENGLFKSQWAIHHLQRIVIYLQLRNTGTPP